MCGILAFFGIENAKDKREFALKLSKLLISLFSSKFFGVFPQSKFMCPEFGSIIVPTLYVSGVAVRGCCFQKYKLRYVWMFGVRLLLSEIKITTCLELLVCGCCFQESELRHVWMSGVRLLFSEIKSTTFLDLRCAVAVL